MELAGESAGDNAGGGEPQGDNKAPAGVAAPGVGQPPQKTKRKHRRGKPKSKNANKPYKNTNWKFQVPRQHYNPQQNNGSKGAVSSANMRNRQRAKLVRSRSLVPYNTNKFLMEEHMAEVPSSLLTPSGRTRDSSFSVDSEDNYFFSLPEDEEEFLTKEFANVYEKARLERLESLTKQELIKELLQIEDRYSKDQGSQQQQQQFDVERISAEFTAKIRALEEKVKELSRENYLLRCQLMRSALVTAASASPPTAAVPINTATQPVPMDSSSEDSETDSSSTSSSSSSSSSNSSGHEQGDNNGQHSCSSRGSRSENMSEHDFNDDNVNIADNNNIAVDIEANPLIDAEEMDEIVDQLADQPQSEVQVQNFEPAYVQPLAVKASPDVGQSPPQISDVDCSGAALGRMVD